MGKYFGTDGFRGKANQELTVNHAFKIGQFLGYYYSLNKNNQETKIVIGKDTRVSGYMLESALCAGLTSVRANAYLMHVTPTPSVAYITRVDNFDCGIMISASHNAFYDNGIKLLNKNGEKMEDEIIALIEDYLDGTLVLDNQKVTDINLVKEDKIGRVFDYALGRDKYVNYLKSIKLASFKGLKVALDLSNGASYLLAESLLKELGATVTVINNKPNGTNINNKCGSTHLETLVNFVKNGDYDCAFAFDGDADRCLGVDELGNEINGDQIIYVYAKYLQEHNELTNNEVVTTIMSNIGLYKALNKLNIKYHPTPVGDKNVHDYMVEHHNLVGGEQSGHMIFSKYANTGDGMLTAIMMLNVLASTKKKMSELIKDCKMYPQTLINVKVVDKNKAMQNANVLKEIDVVSKALGSSGRILVRGSGTEPLVRVMVEAETKEICDKYCNQVIDIMKKEGLTL